MMHGTIASPQFQAETRPGRLRKLAAALVRHRAVVVVVILPTLIVAAYYMLFASNQYISEAHFVVRSNQQASAAPTGLGAVLTQAVGGTTVNETHSVSDYLDSHDAVDTLRRSAGLVAIFQRPEVDSLSRLPDADPAPETLLKYYRKQVKISAPAEDGIVQLTVRTFRPIDSYNLARSLLDLGEFRVNQLNMRAYADSVRQAQRLLTSSESQLADAENAITTFRQGRRDIDPQGTGVAQTTLVTGLRAQLAQARAQLAGIISTPGFSSNAPQAVFLRGRVAALAQQVAAEDARLTSGASSIASGLGDYQGLVLRQKFAATRYETAAAALEKAREEARRQQLFIVRVVEPNLPVKSLYPTPFKTIMIVFATLSLLYALGWLIQTGMREHAG